MFGNLFKKKDEAEQKPAGEAGTRASADKPDSEKSKETIEQRIDREFESLPNQFKEKLKEPGVKQKFVEIAKRMERDGVNLKSIRQMKKWLKDHESELRGIGGAMEQPSQKVETVVNEGPKIGRNDPCPCGSGKKYKKCCGR